MKLSCTAIRCNVYYGTTLFGPNITPISCQISNKGAVEEPSFSGVGKFPNPVHGENFLSPLWSLSEKMPPSAPFGRSWNRLWMNVGQWNHIESRFLGADVHAIEPFNDPNHVLLSIMNANIQVQPISAFPAAKQRQNASATPPGNEIEPRTILRKLIHKHHH